MDDDSATKRNEVTMGMNSENALSERNQSQKVTCWDLPGGPVAKTLCSQCRGSGFGPWSGNWILHAATKIKDLACHNYDLVQPNK